MIRKTLPAFFLGLFIITSCSDKKGDASKADSTADSSIVIKPVTLTTDSGKLVTNLVNGKKNGDASLYDADGKLIQKGVFENDQRTGSWISYDKEGHVSKAVQYSNGKLLHTLDKDDFEMRSWTNSSMGISLQVPKNWTELKSPNPALLASFEKPVKDTAVKIAPNFNIAKAQLQPGDSLSTLAQMEIQLLHEQFPRVEPPIEETFLTIDNYKAFRRFGMYFDGEHKVGYMNVIIIDGKNAYFISCTAQNQKDAEFLKYAGVFNDVVSSFHRN